MIFRGSRKNIGIRNNNKENEKVREILKKKNGAVIAQRNDRV